MKIGLDVDGCLANFCSSFLATINEVSGKNITVPDGWVPPTWYWDEGLGFTKADADAAWDKINSDPGWWYRLGPLVGVYQVPNETENHDLYFITTRSGIMPKIQTEEWLMDYGFENPTVLVSANKGPIAVGLELDVFIDDRDKNVLQVASARPECQCFIIDYPYNRTFDATGNIKRVASVEDAFKEVGLGV